MKRTRDGNTVLITPTDHETDEIRNGTVLQRVCGHRECVLCDLFTCVDLCANAPRCRPETGHFESMGVQV